MSSKTVVAGADHEKLTNWCLPGPCIYPGMTITVAVRVRLEDPKDDNPLVDLSDFFCTCQWGVDAFDVMGCGIDCQTTDFDVVNGGAITVEASSLLVSATYPGIADPTHPPVHVDVSIGIGTSGKAGIASSAQRTVKIGDLAAGNRTGASFAIPPWAVGAILLNTDGTVAAPAMILEQRMGPTLAAPIVAASPLGKRSELVTPIARGLGARFFTVSNLGPAASPGSAIIFCLAPN